jgi:hypothetical protein
MLIERFPSPDPHRLSKVLSERPLLYPKSSFPLIALGKKLPVWLPQHKYCFQTEDPVLGPTAPGKQGSEIRRRKTEKATT